MEGLLHPVEVFLLIHEQISAFRSFIKILKYALFYDLHFVIIKHAPLIVVVGNADIMASLNCVSYVHDDSNQIVFVLEPRQLQFRRESHHTFYATVLL